MLQMKYLLDLWIFGLVRDWGGSVIRGGFGQLIPFWIWFQVDKEPVFIGSLAAYKSLIV